jgi:predicted small metal-binding protein
MPPARDDVSAASRRQWEARMTKVLECRAVVPGCNFVVYGESEEDVMMKEEEHAQRVHGVEHISEQLKAKIRSAIKDR